MSRTRTPMTPWLGSVVDLVEVYRRGERSPVEEVQATVGAISSSRLNACCFLAEDAAATVADVDLTKPLAGVPILVKEIEMVRGWPFTHACELLRDDIAPATSTNVERLVAAGAILVGQSTSSEFARAGHTATRIHGVTRNPWNLTRTPGGSSGGAAAAVAGGLVSLATATDGGGSTRQPAAMCGLPGLKVTHRIVPAGPRAILEPLTVVVTCLTRTIADIARVLDVTAGVDDRDPFSTASAGNFEATVDDSVAGSQAACLLRPSGLSMGVEVETAVAAAFDELVACAGLRRAEVRDVLPPPNPALGLMGPIRILGILGQRTAAERDLLTAEVQEAMDIAQAATPLDVGRVDAARSAVIDAMASMLDMVDVIVTPTAPEPFAAEGPVVPATHLAAVNIAGLPAISLPIGLTRQGLPIGMQVIGHRSSEHLLLRIGRQWERHRPWPLVAPGAPM